MIETHNFCIKLMLLGFLDYVSNFCQVPLAVVWVITCLFCECKNVNYDTWRTFLAVGCCDWNLWSEVHGFQSHRSFCNNRLCLTSKLNVGSEAGRKKCECQFSLIAGFNLYCAFFVAHMCLCGPSWTLPKATYSEGHLWHMAQVMDR